MVKSNTRVRIDEDQVRYRVILTSEPCDPNTDKYNSEFFSLLQEIGRNPGLIACGHSLPDRVVISYMQANSCWNLEASATIYENSDQELNPS